MFGQRADSQTVCRPELPQPELDLVQRLEMCLWFPQPGGQTRHRSILSQVGRVEAGLLESGPCIRDRRRVRERPHQSAKDTLLGAGAVKARKPFFLRTETTRSASARVLAIT